MDGHEMLQKALGDHSRALEAFQAKLVADQRKLADRLFELEQKAAAKPFGGAAYDAGGSDEILAAFAASDLFPRLQRGEIKNASFRVPSRALRVKAILSSITGGTVAAADRGATIVSPAQRRMTIRSLIPSVPTNAGATEFVRELVYTNNAGPQGGAESPTTYNGEGAAKNASEMTFELVTAPVITVAHHFTVSRQALEDSAALGAHIASRGLYGLAVEEEDEMLNGDGTAGQLTGLVSSASAFTGGATNLSPLDVIRRAVTQVALSEHVASAVVLNPRDAETMEVAKDSQSRYLDMVVNGTVWRLPIVATNAMTAGQFLVGDFGMAATIRDRQEAVVEVSLDHADYRTRNLALVLIEERVGLEIHRPTALVTGSLSYAG